ncbi:Metal-dependent amidase/aminoacylase/carboxypeptidase [Halanaeroarchaeum sp. HSR-CO]|uniref:amidohydrolase n=1 Tax=Halanaeroarchaeum sp. HSR-CO TaxID=2866382 RepID=UPI00217DE123|nr:amidohydrolase [Halanaeroarchaeum sp. HSR-CO]UWG47371.1 Metal-dependent amidase/aminoacylase/carboxypeptidase [Halanaeroarchaeum sp. HSR-CO]
MDPTTRSQLIDLRRELHRYPEPAWCEFWTTSRIVDEFERIGVDDYHVGRAVLSSPDRMAVPDEAARSEWLERARENDARYDVLEATTGGHTGAIAVLERGAGPTVALRVDIDALWIEESVDGAHAPAELDFRSQTGETMHACGHDAHATIGIGVLEAVAQSSFQGTFKVFFQPAEEQVGGGKAMAESGHLDDVEYLFALHVGLDHPTGTVVAGIDEFLAVNHFDADFVGESAHAGAHPEAGRNAVQAMTTAVQNLYGIARHDGGATRVNVGPVGGGSSSNIVPATAFVEGEVRGETTELMEYMRERANVILENAADMHDCDVDVETVGQAPSAESDDELIDLVSAVAHEHSAVTDLVERAPLGGSEDATYLMRAVQERGGLATYVVVGTDHPGGHHTDTFDVDEETIPIAVEVLTDAVLAVGDR